MIYLERTIDIKKGVGSIDEPVILYKGDKNVEVQFTIKNNPFKSKKNLEPTFGQLVIDREATSIFSTVSNLSNGKVIFVITGDMIDELVEVGEYTFQIRLFNEEQTSRVTLPVINGGIIIKQPICDGEESVANINKATVNDAIIPYSEPESMFNQDGNYNKTIWADGDLITDSKLNKVEDALDYLVAESKTHITNEELNEALKDVDVDLSGYATESYANSIAGNARNEAMNYALGLNNNKADKDHSHDEYLTEHQSLDGLATEAYVNDAIGNIDAILDAINGEVL